MALVTGNPVLRGFSGTLGGNLVFRQYGNKTVVAVKSDAGRRNRNNRSKLQQMSTDRFREASNYARKLLSDPGKRDHYRKLAKKLGKHSGYNLVISEYMRGIKISIESAVGVAMDGKRIKLRIDKGGYAVNDVAICVCRNGQTISQGKANRISGNKCVYTLRAGLAKTMAATAHGPDGSEVLYVRVVDAFGTLTQKEFILRED
jgi:hypothetical protein